MSEEKFQAIIIGAGMAGNAAAYRLAKAGREVLLIDRGSNPGAKNMTGGRLYSYAMKELMPEEWQEAPFEREVNREMVVLMAAKDGLIVDTSFGTSNQQSYTVLRGKFDAWLASKAEEQGAMLIPETTIEGLIIREGKVCGIKTGEEEMEADLVIDAEGVNAIVAERAGLIRPVALKDIAVGVKYVYRLSEEKINDRFNTESGKGTAMLCMGECSKGIFGGAFLYTNKESISLGLVLDSQGWKNSKMRLADAAEDLKQHPVLKRYIAGGELIEYSAHLIPEGGYNSLPRLYSDGFLLAGDAAGLCMNRGFTVRGMDYAILSGIAAAETANEAIEANNYSKGFLSAYESKLQSRVIKDFKTMKKSHDYMAHSRHLFTTYPDVALTLMKNLYNVDKNSLESVYTLFKKSIKGEFSYISLLKDLMKGVRSL